MIIIKEKINMTNSISLIDKQDRIRRLSDICRQGYPKLPYHNYNHALDVSYHAEKYARYHKLPENKIFLLKSAALLHDIIYVPKAENNEEKSFEYAKLILPTIDYKTNEMKIIGRLILATKWPTNPQGLLEKIICDADLDNLGRKDFFEKSSNLMQEWEIPDDKTWYQNQLSLLKNNHYYTDIARKLRDKGKQENLEKLKKMLEGLKC